MAAAERGDGHEPHLYTRRDVFATKADHLQSGWPPDRVTEADVLGGRRGEFESVWCVLPEYGDVRRCAPVHTIRASDKDEDAAPWSRDSHPPSGGSIVGAVLT